MIRVLIADDHEVIRLVLQKLLGNEADITVIGAAADGRAAVTMAADDPPDVVLMDFSMPVLDGVAATRSITLADASVKVLMLTGQSNESTIREAFAAGASGYLLKGSPPERLLEAIRAVHRGESAMDPVVRGAICGHAEG
jgi:DNA-binding NarL/FixJ family response regulator